jgi:3-deoxy-7-phosphoheptulonate synthase
MRERYQPQLEIVMRTYFEKPRTVVGWKGLISDPDLNGSYRVNHGIELARRLLLQVNELGVPTATEFLDMVTGQFIADLISWGAIGARTTESQIHREMASALSCPVGFKNGTDGNTRIAVDAIRASRASHMFLSPDKQGQMTIYQTSGNPYGHIIMRGGKSRIITPKISPPPAKRCVNLICRNSWWLISATATARNSTAVSWRCAPISASRFAPAPPPSPGSWPRASCRKARRKWSRPAADRGQSITDPCLSWEDSERLLAELAAATATRL